MAGLTIVMIVENEAEYVKLALESIRIFADIEDYAVVVVDNGSTDGLQQWASEQDDFTYVYVDENRMPFGQAVNEVCRMLEIDGDLMLMDAHFMLTPNCLSGMRKALYENDTIGAVGAMSNGFYGCQRFNQLDNYEDAIAWKRDEQNLDSKQVVGLCPEVVLLKAQAVEALGQFDETFASQYYAIKDYCFRMVLNDWKLMLCQTAILWEVRGNNYFVQINKAEEEALQRKWEMHYFNATYNERIVRQIEAEVDAEIHILEIGCDCGATLLEIKNRNVGAKVYGYELNERAAQVATHFATVKVGNIEEEKIDFDGQLFDYIIFGDVLEHLHNPLRTIQYCRSLLKKDGHIVASIPNLMHISVMEELLKGNFTYTEVGLLDRTHIHLFTYNEIIRMFEKGGYQVVKVEPVVYNISKRQEELITQLLALNCATEEHMYKTFQYLICAKCV